jgi:DNA-directed RNA polymerase specialized sigma24 family protein
MLKINREKRRLDRQQLFLERYALLRTSAMRLAQGDSVRAEDLLHDAFVQFVLTQLDLPPIQNLDGYLYALLRNVHISTMRQAKTEFLQRNGRETGVVWTNEIRIPASFLQGPRGIPHLSSSRLKRALKGQPYR